MHRDHSEILAAALRGWQAPPVVHTVFGGFWDATRTASFEVLVSPPSLSSAGWALGLSSRLSKMPLGTGAQVDAFMERSSAAELPA
jgi:hypothetical protein